jgi:predicted RNA binding protein YcfA (HicA-like mRNA interferase family)
MESREIVKRLSGDGWKRSFGKGEHRKYKHPDKPGHVVLPLPRRKVPVGLLRNIFRQAGWDWR